MPFLIALLVTLLPAITTAEQTSALEGLATCKQDDPVKLVVKEIREGKGFKSAGGNFYSPTNEIKAFGFNIKYIGLMGVDMVPGPNITLEGKFTAVKKSILTALKTEFECGSGGCAAEVEKNLQIMVYPHPTDNDLSIVQCGYFGP